MWPGADWQACDSATIRVNLPNRDTDNKNLTVVPTPRHSIQINTTFAFR